MLLSKQMLDPTSMAYVRDFCQSSGDRWWFCLLGSVEHDTFDQIGQEALATMSNNSFYV